MVSQAAAFITPMQEWGAIGVQTEKKTGMTGREESSLFGDIFKNTVNEVYETQLDVEKKQYLLSTGQLDDAHSLPIAQAKASLSLETMVTLRNKVLESYHELIKMNV